MGFFSHQPTLPSDARRMTTNADLPLCAAAYFVPWFTNKVIGGLPPRTRSLAPSHGIDLEPIVRHCLRPAADVAGPRHRVERAAAGWPRSHRDRPAHLHPGAHVRLQLPSRTPLGPAGRLEARLCRGAGRAAIAAWVIGGILVVGVIIVVVLVVVFVSAGGGTLSRRYPASLVWASWACGRAGLRRAAHQRASP